jgi:hypothetical protein
MSDLKLSACRPAVFLVRLVADLNHAPIFAGHEFAHGALLFGLQPGIRADLGWDGAISPVLACGLSHARGISVQWRRVIGVRHLGFSRRGEGVLL